VGGRKLRKASLAVGSLYQAPFSAEARAAAITYRSAGYADHFSGLLVSKKTVSEGLTLLAELDVQLFLTPFG
jgi:hypothetical protein